MSTTFHQSVRLGFRKLAAAEPRRIKVLDGHRREEEIFERDSPNNTAIPP